MEHIFEGLGWILFAIAGTIAYFGRAIVIKWEKDNGVYDIINEQDKSNE